MKEDEVHMYRRIDRISSCLILTASPIKSPCRGYITVHPHLYRWRVSLENRKEEQADVVKHQNKMYKIYTKLFHLGFR
jgi:hypothetical protein